jgi:CheY-like chemotaxis protein
VLLLAAVTFSAKPESLPVVLLVEDHRDTRQMYAEFLAAFFTVVQAADGEEALRLVKERPPDLIITDLSLPGIDGFELITRIRSDPKTRRVPVISLSGYGGYTHQQQALQAGCDRVLEKPCLPDALADVALKLLGKPSAGSDET